MFEKMEKNKNGESTLIYIFFKKRNIHIYLCIILYMLKKKKSSL